MQHWHWVWRCKCRCEVLNVQGRALTWVTSIRMHCTASLSCSDWGFLVIRKQMGSNFHELSQKLTNIQRTFNISQAEKNLVKSEKYLNVHHTSILGAMDVKVCGCFIAVDKNEILGLNFIRRNVMCEKYFHGGRYWETWPGAVTCNNNNEDNCLGS